MVEEEQCLVHWQEGGWEEWILNLPREGRGGHWHLRNKTKNELPIIKNQVKFLHMGGRQRGE